MHTLRLILIGLAACGSSARPDTSGPNDQGPDAAAGSEPDGATLSADSGTPQAPATILVFVHGGSSDLAPFRVCLDSAGAPLPSDHPMPRANYPGVPVGAAASLGDVDSHTSFTVTLVDALALADSKSQPWANDCSMLPDFLPPAALETTGPKVQLVAGAFNVAVVLGAAGARTVKVVTLDATPPALNKMRLQWGQFATGLGTASATFGGAALGNAAPQAVASASVEVAFDPSSSPAAFDGSGVTVTGTDGIPRFFSLTDIQAASDPTTVPTQFFSGRVSYGVIGIGDAAQLHLVAIPVQL